MRTSLQLMVFALMLALSSCKSDPLDVDVSETDVQLTFKRLDRDLFELNPSAGKTETEALNEKYGEFLVDYCEGVIRIGDPKSESFKYAVAQFISDEAMKTLYQQSQLVYPDLTSVEKELTEAFRYYKYHFPDSTIPEIVFSVSALNYAIVTTNTTLNISLDMFLGADYEVYPAVGLPQYMYMNMKPDQIVPQAMKGWLQSSYETDLQRNTLLDYMIFEGKLLYVLDATLRDYEDSTKIGFSPEAIRWCEDYEAKVWTHLVDQKLLYTTEYMVINKWINQAPFVAGIPKDSPGRLGQWVGWQIVREYMKENPETSLQQLMANQNTQEILALSKYKPKI